MLRFSSRGHLPLVRQSEAAECGLACLAMVASFHGHRVDINTLRRRYPVSLNGVTLRSLIQVAIHMGLVSRPLRFELGHLRQLRLPAILHWDMSHFVVLKSVCRKGITIHDPASGAKFLTVAEASKHLTGVALELTPAEGFVRPMRARPRFSKEGAGGGRAGHAWPKRDPISKRSVSRLRFVSPNGQQRATLKKGARSRPSTAGLSALPSQIRFSLYAAAMIAPMFSGEKNSAGETVPAFTFAKPSMAF